MFAYKQFKQKVDDQKKVINCQWMDLSCVEAVERERERCDLPVMRLDWSKNRGKCNFETETDDLGRKSGTRTISKGEEGEAS